MGVIQFQVEHPEYVPRHGLNHADFVMFDGRILASETSLSNGILKCHRPQTHSSLLRLLYQLDENQTPQITHSTSLRETDTDYRLEVELARGELSRLRNYYDMWRGAGLQASPELDARLRKAQQVFFHSAMSSGTADGAVESLRMAQNAIEELCQLYTSQRLVFRRQRSAHFPIFVGCRLSEMPSDPDRYLEAFSAVGMETSWALLEPEDGRYEWDRTDAVVDWAQSEKLFIFGGPLIDLASQQFPEWMQAWKGDIVNLQSFASDFVETVVGRYVGRIRHWEVVCGANCGGSAGLTEEQRLNLVIWAVEAARQVDEQIQISLRVVQPWGEYLNDTANRLTPIQFIDTLRRTGVQITEANLEIRFGMGGRQSLPRDHLALSQLLDHWSLLQMPLNVVLALPEHPGGDSDDFASQQSTWLQNTLLMCLSKERVSGVYCDSLYDSTRGTGMIRPDGSLHPAWEQLVRIEEEYWPAT